MSEGGFDAGGKPPENGSETPVVPQKLVDELKFSALSRHTSAEGFVRRFLRREDQQFDNQSLQENLHLLIADGVKAEPNASEIMETPDMPGVDILAERGRLTKKDAAAVKQRMHMLLTLQPLLDDPDIEFNEDAKVRLRELLITIAREPQTEYDIDYATFKDMSSDDFRKYFQKVFALNIQYKAQDISDSRDMPYPVRFGDEYRPPLGLTEFQDEILKIGFSPAYPANAFLAQSQAMLHHDIIPQGTVRDIVPNMRVRALAATLGRLPDTFGELNHYLPRSTQQFDSSTSISTVAQQMNAASMESVVANVDMELEFNLQLVEGLDDQAKKTKRDEMIHDLYAERQASLLSYSPAQKKEFARLEDELTRPVPADPAERALELRMLNVSRENIQEWIDSRGPWLQ